MSDQDSKTQYDYDLVVIGTGPGGEGAAMQAAKAGMRVAAAERYQAIGGGCTHWGTIPSKALRHAISSTIRAMQNPVIRSIGLQASPSVLQLRQGTERIVSKQVNMRRTFYQRNDVEVLSGQARFLDPHTMQIGDDEPITFKNAVIAVGSRPYQPPNVDFNHPRIYDSDSILQMERKPQSITIYGAGVIGTEYASMMRGIGMKVNLINTRDNLLSFLDDEIIDALSYHLRDSGVLIRHNEVYEKIYPTDDGVIIELKSGKRIKSDALLWANGRSGNTDDLGLETIGLEPNSRGNLEVGEQFQTKVPHIYAVGDVIGFPALASAAYTQGRFAGMHIIGKCEDSLRLDDIPTGIYTDPEISSVGKTERELTQECVPYEVGHSQFKSLARAQISGQTVGMLKILFHRETLEILGVHCFGDNASEIIHIGQAIMNQPPGQNTLEYFFESTFNYPTMAEAYRVAALNGYNRLF